MTVWIISMGHGGDGCVHSFAFPTTISTTTSRLLPRTYHRQSTKTTHRTTSIIKEQQQQQAAVMVKVTTPTTTTLNAFSNENDIRGDGSFQDGSTFMFQNPFKSRNSEGANRLVRNSNNNTRNRMRQGNSGIQQQQQQQRGGILPVSNGEIWDFLPRPVMVQGGSLRTWSFSSEKVNSVQVHLKTEGRPLNANIDIWHGPDNTPQRMGVYLEEGGIRAFRVVIATPGRGQSAVAVKNTATQEFPLMGAVEADSTSGSSLEDVARSLFASSTARTVQGGAVTTTPFSPSVSSIVVMLSTDGRPLNARIELLQGPNNLKQVMEVYTEDGMERPFLAIVETPGVGNVLRIVNTSPIEFPITSRIEPYLVAEDMAYGMIADGYEDNYNNGNSNSMMNGDNNNFFFTNRN
jgi:hypothetical protein